MMDEINEMTEALAGAVRRSAQYERFRAARERADSNGTTRALLAEYSRLRTRAQAEAVAGREDKGTLERLQKLGELLQMDPDASEYLIAEFMLSDLVGGVYRRIARAAELDLSMLE